MKKYMGLRKESFKWVLTMKVFYFKTMETYILDKIKTLITTISAVKGPETLY